MAAAVYVAALEPDTGKSVVAVNDLSRGCMVADVGNTVAITAIQAQTRATAGLTTVSLPA